MKKAIQFGAGNIGRGFIGAILEQAGYHVIYADINQEIIDKINQKKEYSVYVRDTKSYEQTIKNISALNSLSEELIRQAVDANFITTAVGLTILPSIAQTIAQAIKLRKKQNIRNPLNIIACENGIRATSFLKEEVEKYLEKDIIEWMNENIGFADCSVDRIVPPFAKNNSIDVVVEGFYEWNVEKGSIAGDQPTIKGMELVDDLIVSIERKLFTLNTGHATTAYLGLLKGYETIGEAIADTKILSVVRAAMQESGLALIAKHNMNQEEHFEYIEKIIERFKNPYLKDDLRRVGREPIRKLSKDDRMIKPLITAQQYDLKTENLVLGIAAALHYSDQRDKQSIRMQSSIEEKGVKQTLADISEINLDNPILEEIENQYKIYDNEKKSYKH